eukprot:2517799-Amphidinium_carterae.1
MRRVTYWVYLSDALLECARLAGIKAQAKVTDYHLIVGLKEDVRRAKKVEKTNHAVLLPPTAQHKQILL